MLRRDYHTPAGRLRHMVLLVAGLAAMTAAQTVVLKADNNDGHDDVWQKRHYYGKNTWGIRGSHKVESGGIWFNSFPGSSGEYKISMGTIFENDGRPYYRVTAGGRTIREGRYPYESGSKNCDKPGAAGRLDLGAHTVNKGEKISIWGKSDYACGLSDGGSYALWYELEFVKVDGSSGPECGNGVCETGEDCSTCESDCGSCGSSAPETRIIAPTEEKLVEGRSYTLEGEGENLRWEYDAANDDGGWHDIETGSTVDFTVPVNITDPRTLTLRLTGANGTVTRSYAVVSPGNLVTLIAPNGGETVHTGDTLVIRWTTDTAVVTDVDILLSPNAGQAWLRLNTAGSVSVTDADDWGHYAWRVPETLRGDGRQSYYDLTDNSNCLVRVEQYEATQDFLRDLSDSTFTILSGAAATRTRRAGVIDTRRSISAIVGDRVHISLPAGTSSLVSIVRADGCVMDQFIGRGEVRRPLPASSGVYFLRVQSGAVSTIRPLPIGCTTAEPEVRR